MKLKIKPDSSGSSPGVTMAGLVGVVTVISAVVTGLDPVIHDFTTIEFLVTEVTHAREDHGDARFVGGFDDFVVAHGATH